MRKQRTIYYLVIFCMAALITGCNSKTDKKDSSTTDTSATVTTGDNIPVEAKLVCKSMGEDSLATPHSDVYLSVGGKETKIRSINTCNEISKADYKTYEIPDNAISAVGGWWAGGGNYFYLIQRDGKNVVFEGWQDEGQKGTGYNWKEITVE